MEDKTPVDMKNEDTNVTEESMVSVRNIVIEQYAIYLGINPSEDKDLMWIARDGYSAEVPEPWVECTDEEGECYYYNKETKERKWEHPMDEYYKELYQSEKAKKVLNKNKEDGVGDNKEDGVEDSKEDDIEFEDYEEVINKQIGAPPENPNLIKEIAINDNQVNDVIDTERKKEITNEYKEEMKVNV